MKMRKLDYFFNFALKAAQERIKIVFPYANNSGSAKALT